MEAKKRISGKCSQIMRQARRYTAPCASKIAREAFVQLVELNRTTNKKASNSRNTAATVSNVVSTDRGPEYKKLCTAFVARYEKQRNPYMGKQKCREQDAYRG